MNPIPTSDSAQHPRPRTVACTWWGLTAALAAWMAGYATALGGLWWLVIVLVAAAVTLCVFDRGHHGPPRRR